MAKVAITREYTAAIEKVWEALTTPEIIMKFWAPPGMETVAATIDKLEPGGVFRYSMKSPEGFQQWVKCTYEEVIPPTKLSFMETITDEEGNPVPPSHFGMPGDEIKHHLTELVLEQDGNTTKLTMYMDYGDEQSNQYAQGGWKGMLENLDTVLE